MTDGLVDLQRNLVPVQHDGHHAARALVSAEKCSRLLGDAGRLAGEVEPVDVLPAALAARTNLRARIAPHLEDTVTSCGASIPAPHSISSCSTSVPSEVSKSLCSRCARTIVWRTRMSGPAIASSASRHCATFSRERNIEWVTLDRRAVCAACGSYGSELSQVLSWGGAREGAGSEGRVACAVGGKPAVTGEPPGAVEEHPHADALALRIGEAFDASALRRHELVSLHHDACVRVLGSRSSSRIHRRCTEVSHARDSNQAARTIRSAHGYNAPAFKRWWRNW